MRPAIERRETGQLRVAEWFGPTIQGEGPATGTACTFLRLGGCNLSCSWCDTPYTWDASRFDLSKELRQVDVGDLVEEVVDLAGETATLVLTGGEPLFQQGPDLYRFLEAMRAEAISVHVETNGTLAPSERLAQLVELFAVSPKLGNAGPHRGRQDPALHPAWGDLALRHGQVHLKVVCKDLADVDAAAELADDAGIFRFNTWVMPEGTTPDALAERFPQLCDAAAVRGLSVSHRLHVLAWGDKRGH